MAFRPSGIDGCLNDDGSQLCNQPDLRKRQRSPVISTLCISMFEQAVNRIIGHYNFDPLQLALIEQQDGCKAIRVRYFSHGGEVVLDFSLNHTRIMGLEASLDNAKNHLAPIKLKLTQKNSYILHLAKFDPNKSKYTRGSFGVLLLRFLPVSAIACSAKHSSALKFLSDLESLMHNKSLNKDAPR